jgi:prophage regulatory protein
MAKTERERLGLGPNERLDLVGAPEIAEILSVSRTRAFDISQKKGFPDPVAELGGSERLRSFWLRSDVEAWKDAYYKPRH